VASSEAQLVVAVTGPTGTFGFGFVPLLESEPRIGRIVGIARRRFDPAQHGWAKMEYRQGDVRDPEALGEAFAGADVVVHLAFMITGTASAETIRAINVQGTLNAFRAAADAGAKRFVYASSVAAYGFHPDNPVGITEDWPTRPADRLFYAREKAELEQLLDDEAQAGPGPALYLLRPPIVLGPHAAGAKGALPEPVARAGRWMLELVNRIPVPVPVLVADAPMQFIHEHDVGQALVKCVLAEGPPGAYNIAGDGVLTGLTWRGSLAWPRSRSRPRSFTPRRGRRRRCPSRRSHRPAPIGSRRSVIRRSWTPPRPGRSSAGARDTPRSRPCEIL